jgi:hypothetical protein
MDAPSRLRIGGFGLDSIVFKTSSREDLKGNYRNYRSTFKPLIYME